MNDDATLNSTLRSDLSLFVRKVFATVSPNDAFKPNWHIEAIAHELTRCHAGENRRLLITQPPRSLKSICASVAFPAWALGHDPTQRFLCVSYSEGLANEFTRQFRMVTESEWYRRVFPGMRLKTETRTEAITTRGGGRVALSVGGSITGRGADFIIIDDPLKAEDGASETARTRVIDWYHGTLSTRLNDKERGVIILVMQRLHREDRVVELRHPGSFSEDPLTVVLRSGAQRLLAETQAAVSTAEARMTRVRLTAFTPSVLPNQNCTGTILYPDDGGEERSPGGCAKFSAMGCGVAIVLTNCLRESLLH